MTLAGVKGSSLKLSYYSIRFHIFSNQEASPLLEGKANAVQEEGTLLYTILDINNSILSLMVSRPLKP
jgi:hypothetical protein